MAKALELLSLPHHSDHSVAIFVMLLTASVFDACDGFNFIEDEVSSIRQNWRHDGNLLDCMKEYRQNILQCKE